MNDITHQIQALIDAQKADAVERALLAERISKVETNTGELVAMFNAAMGGLKVLGGLGQLIKWTAAVGVAGATLWTLVTGRPPLIK
jgi:hypothetical protein